MVSGWNLLVWLVGEVRMQVSLVQGKSRDNKCRERVEFMDVASKFG